MATAAGEVGQEDGRKMIGVSVTLFADMRRYLPPGVDGPHRREVPAGSTVAALLEIIGIPADTDITVGVDGELADRATPLRDGADVMVLSPMEGGSSPPAEMGMNGETPLRVYAESRCWPARRRRSPHSFHNLTEETP